MHRGVAAQRRRGADEKEAKSLATSPELPVGVSAGSLIRQRSFLRHRFYPPRERWERVRRPERQRVESQISNEALALSLKFVLSERAKERSATERLSPTRALPAPARRIKSKWKNATSCRFCPPCGRWERGRSPRDDARGHKIYEKRFSAEHKFCTERVSERTNERRAATRLSPTRAITSASPTAGKIGRIKLSSSARAKARAEIIQRRQFACCASARGRAQQLACEGA